MSSWRATLGTLFGPQTLITIGVLGIALALFVPVPPAVLDVLLTLSLTAGVFVLLTVLRLQSPMEFSTFPSLLLILTFFRLAMNVASTRLILTTGGGGQVITGFGEYVVGGSLVVGMVVFLILNIINFVVITKGAGRIAEVAARFALDALPGKQMAIDQELANNSIDEREASRRRDELVRETNFAGVMDGAMKFVRGDAIAGLIITAINLLGGFALGVLVQGMDARSAMERYAILSIGDGLVSQIPAVLISLGAALLATYSSKGPGFASGLAAELGASPSTLKVAGGAMALLGIAPGLPLVPFALLGGALFFGGAAMERRRVAEAPVETPPVETGAARATELQVPGEVDVDLGMHLIETIREGLLPRLTGLRDKLSMELGFHLPPARIRDNMELLPNNYQISIREERLPIGIAMPKHLLVFRDDGGPVALPGMHAIATTDPVLRRPAAWVPEDRRVDVEVMPNYRVHDVSTVIATHIADTLRKNAWRLLTRQQVHGLIKNLQERSPVLVDELVPSKLSFATLHRVLEGLLKEGVSIRQLDMILEALGDAPPDLRDIDTLVEMARRRLGGVIAQRFLDRDGVLRPIVLSPEVELGLLQLTTLGASQHSERSRPLSPDEIQQIVQSAARLATEHRRGSEPRPFLVVPSLRSTVRRLVEQGVPYVPVLATSEIPVAVGIEPIAKLELTRA